MHSTDEIWRKQFRIFHILFYLRTIFVPSNWRFFQTECTHTLNSIECMKQVKKSFEFVQVFGNNDTAWWIWDTKQMKNKDKKKNNVEYNFETLSDTAFCSTIWHKWFDPSCQIHVHVSLLKRALSLSLSVIFFWHSACCFSSKFQCSLFSCFIFCAVVVIFRSFVEQRRLNMDFVTCIQQCGAVLLLFSMNKIHFLELNPCCIVFACMSTGLTWFFRNVTPL